MSVRSGRTAAGNLLELIDNITNIIRQHIEPKGSIFRNPGKLKNAFFTPFSGAQEYSL